MGYLSLQYDFVTATILRVIIVSFIEHGTSRLKVPNELSD